MKRFRFVGIENEYDNYYKFGEVYDGEAKQGEDRFTVLQCSTLFPEDWEEVGDVKEQGDEVFI